MSAITASIQHVMTALSAAGVPALVGGRVYQGVAPVTAKHPLILIQTYGDTTDLLGVGKPHAASTVELVVRVVAATDSLTGVETVHDAVFDALHGTSGDNTRGSIASCVRVSESELSEATDAGTIRYLTGRYRLVCSPIRN